MIAFAYENVKYYKNTFDKLKLKPSEIKHVSDLQKLPIITKEIIKEHEEEFKPLGLYKRPYYGRSTGGTTGTPLFYRISKNERFLSLALLYRGWRMAGYKYGDPMVFIAGSSLNISDISSFKTIIEERVRNIKKLSSFDMTENNLFRYADIINTFKPDFIRGYPTSITFFADWLSKKNINIYSPKAIFTTSEKLYPEMVSRIKRAFNCEVFDGYGLNDGGLSAHECNLHRGFHIDTERSVLEVVNSDGLQTAGKEGRIIATSLTNFAMPFLRYDTGDIGKTSIDACPCGNTHPLLSDIVGRSVDMLVTPEGTHIHGWFFQHILWEYSDCVKEYQVVQNKIDQIDILIVKDKNFRNAILDEIMNIVKSRSLKWHINFIFVNNISRTLSGKYKYVINNIE
jgi:phenylacetate-CoA ligase